MAILSGFKFLLSTPTGADVPFQSARPAENLFTTIGGFQSNGLNISAEGIDITNKSSGEWRELLKNRGKVSLDISGAGIMDDTDLKKELELNVINEKLRWFKLTREDNRSFYALCKIVSLNFQGQHDQAMTFDFALQSSGGVIIQDAGGFTYDGGQRRITAFSNRLPAFDYINDAKYASPAYALANLPDTPARTRLFQRFLELEHGLPATLVYELSDKTWSANVHAIGDKEFQLEYVRLTGTSARSSDPNYEPDRGKYRVTFGAGDGNPFPKNIKALRVAVGDGNPVNIPLTPDGAIQNATAFLSTNALAADPIANTDDLNIQYNFVYTDDTFSYTEVDILNADKSAGGAATIDIEGRAVANMYSFPFLFLRKDQVENKSVQFIDSLDQVVNSQFIFLAEKTDDTGVVWYAYYLNMALGSAEDFEVKIQIGD